MASKNGNGTYSSDRAKAAAATFGPKDKQLAAIEAAYAGAESDAERDEVRQAVLDNLDPAAMGRERIKALHRAVGMLDPHEAEQAAELAWAEQFPVILSKPENKRGAEIQKQIAAAEQNRNRGVKPYDDLGYFVREVRKLQAEQKQVNEDFANGPMADYLAQQERMTEFSRDARSRSRGRTLDDVRANGADADDDLILVPDDADSGTVVDMQLRLNAAEERRRMATRGVKAMREAKSPEELTRILAGIEGIAVETKGEGSR